MTSVPWKVAAVLCLFLGEAIAIGAEILASRAFGVAGHPFLSAFIRTLPLLLVGSTLLVSGYILGYAAFRNIWIVSVISITSILFIEPILDVAIFRQWPTVGAVVGFVLGIAGFGCVMFL